MRLRNISGAVEYHCKDEGAMRSTLIDLMQPAPMCGPCTVCGLTPLQEPSVAFNARRFGIERCNDCFGRSRK